MFTETALVSGLDIFSTTINSNKYILSHQTDDKAEISAA